MASNQPPVGVAEVEALEVGMAALGECDGAARRAQTHPATVTALGQCDGSISRAQTQPGMGEGAAALGECDGSISRAQTQSAVVPPLTIRRDVAAGYSIATHSMHIGDDDHPDSDTERLCIDEHAWANQVADADGKGELVVSVGASAEPGAAAEPDSHRDVGDGVSSPKSLLARPRRRSMRPLLDNFLAVDGVGKMAMDEGLELLGSALPQSRQYGLQYRNLALAVAGSGYRCPILQCSTVINPVPCYQGERDKARHLLRLDVDPMNREQFIFDHWEQHHCPTSVSSRWKANCPFFGDDGKGCSAMVYPRESDLQRHMKSVHGVTEFSQYDLKERAHAIVSTMDPRPKFEPIEPAELMAAFTRGWAVRGGLVANALQPQVELDEPVLRKRSRRNRRKVLGDMQTGSEAAMPLLDHAHQPQPQDDVSSAKRPCTFTVSVENEPPEGDGSFSMEPLRRHRAGRRRKSGKIAPCDRQPRRHGTKLASCNVPPGKTSKVSSSRQQVLRAAVAADEAQRDARAQAHKLEQVFHLRRAEMLGVVDTFKGSVYRLPAFSRAADSPILNHGPSEAMVEMVRLSRSFLSAQAKEHQRLVAHCKLLGLSSQLGDHYADDVYKMAAAREDLAPGVINSVAARVAASAAGSEEQQVVQATPPSAEAPMEERTARDGPHEGIRITFAADANQHATRESLLHYKIPRLSTYAEAVKIEPRDVAPLGGRSVAMGSVMTSLGRPCTPRARSSAGSAGAAADVEEPEPMMVDSPLVGLGNPTSEQHTASLSMMSHLTEIMDIVCSGVFTGQTLGEEGRAFLQRFDVKPPIPKR